MRSEIARKADFSLIRYGQCWEDADVLLRALEIKQGDTCLAIASAGDNALAMLAGAPRRVIAIDLNPAQIACVELRVAAYRNLEHAEFLELYGSRASDRRAALYARCRSSLPDEARSFWDARPAAIAQGFGDSGKFERYFTLFRRHVLPLIHSRRDAQRLLDGGDLSQRTAFYDRVWDSWRWRALFRVFFSRTVMGALGRDPRFFDYVDGSIGQRLLDRSRHALVDLDPADNPYLHWIITGRHGDALPAALRPENYAAIRANLDRLEIRCGPLESFLEAYDGSIDRFNLSDIFEYMSPQNYRDLLVRLLARAAPGARLVYWNMMAPRSRPHDLAGRLEPLRDLAARLHVEDRTFFYSALVVEGVAA
ncbi:MAG: BtaA family protein [Candidatus Eremiobacteraeota bacterium]|nr:BtaA family protein [Candidatus Eremiobacteraeota bacterium]